MAPYHFGFSMAVNQMFFSINPIENLPKIRFDTPKIPDFNADSAYIRILEGRYTFGFTIGIISNLRLGEYFDLRFLPDLAFGERELVYSIDYWWKAPNPDTPPQQKDQIKKIYSTFVDFPLHIKYKSKRLHNTRAYLLAGGKYSLDLASEAKKNQDEVDNKHVRINKSDIAVEVGVGFDFYTAYFKFGIETKMSYGLWDLLIREDNLYTDALDKLTSKLFHFTLTFE